MLHRTLGEYDGDGSGDGREDRNRLGNRTGNGDGSLIGVGVGAGIGRDPEYMYHFYEPDTWLEFLVTPVTTIEELLGNLRLLTD